MTERVWVFGYGSLVSPASLGGTLGRAPVRGVDFLVAECAGWERRWNYGHTIDPSRYLGPEVDRIDTVVALGTLPAKVWGVARAIVGLEERATDREA